MPAKRSLPAVVIHAGAGKPLQSRAKETTAREKLTEIVNGAFLRLKHDSALNVATWAVTQLEDEPMFNAGHGAKLQSDGVARLTASLMDGTRMRFAGVVNIERVRNPILLSKELLHARDRVLASEGARNFARDLNVPDFDPVTEANWAEWKHKSELGPRAAVGLHGTVGAVVVDRQGKLAAATSTGGKGMERVGRMSDSATVAGNYASSRAAVSCTGVGEEIVEAAMAARIVLRVDDGMSLRESFQKTMRELRKMKGRAGAIGVDWKGNVHVDTTTQCILHALRTPTLFAVYPR